MKKMMKKKMKSKKRKLGSEPDDKFQQAFGLEEGGRLMHG